MSKIYFLTATLLSLVLLAACGGGGAAPAPITPANCDNTPFHADCATDPAAIAVRQTECAGEPTSARCAQTVRQICGGYTGTPANPFDTLCINNNAYNSARISACIGGHDTTVCANLFGANAIREARACNSDPLIEGCASARLFASRFDSVMRNHFIKCESDRQSASDITDCVRYTACLEGDIFAPECEVLTTLRAERAQACHNGTSADCAGVNLRPNAANLIIDPAHTLPATPNTTSRTNQLLQGNAAGNGLGGIASGATVLTSNTLRGQAADGVAFYRYDEAVAGSPANHYYYAGVLSGTDFGAPITDTSLNGEWRGTLQLVTNEAVTRAINMRLTVTFGGTRTISSLVQLSDTLRIQLDGGFNPEGLITTGTTTYGIYNNANNAFSTEADATQPGTLVGVIGSDGAAGAFISTPTGDTGYAGGFIATPDGRIPPKAAEGVDYDDWLTVVATAPTPNATRANEFLQSTLTSGTARLNADTGARPTALNLTNRAGNHGDVAFYRYDDSGTDYYYAGILSGADLGAPIETADLDGQWRGTLRYILDGDALAVRDLTFTLDFTNSEFTASADTSDGLPAFAFAGNLVGNGFTGTSTYDASHLGTVAGILGERGAIAAFVSNAGVTTGYAGGFTASSPTLDDTVDNDDFLIIAKPENTGAAANQFLEGTANGLVSTANPTTLNLNADYLGVALSTVTADEADGVAFFAEPSTNTFRAGIFSGTDLGAPLQPSGAEGQWRGVLSAEGNGIDIDERSFTLHVDLQARTLKAFIPIVANNANAANALLIDGVYDANTGVITGAGGRDAPNGLLYGYYTDFELRRPSTDPTRVHQGILRGLIGQDGAVGAFVSGTPQGNFITANPAGNLNYAGGFIARPAADCGETYDAFNAAACRGDTDGIEQRTDFCEDPATTWNANCDIARFVANAAFRMARDATRDAACLAFGDVLADGGHPNCLDTSINTALMRTCTAATPFAAPGCNVWTGIGALRLTYCSQDASAWDTNCDDDTAYDNAAYTAAGLTTTRDNARDTACLARGTDADGRCATNDALEMACPVTNPFTGVGTTRCDDVMGIADLRMTYCAKTDPFSDNCAGGTYGDVAQLQLRFCQTQTTMPAEGDTIRAQCNNRDDRPALVAALVTACDPARSGAPYAHDGCEWLTDFGTWRDSWCASATETTPNVGQCPVLLSGWIDEAPDAAGTGTLEVIDDLTEVAEQVADSDSDTGYVSEFTHTNGTLNTEPRTQSAPAIQTAEGLVILRQQPPQPVGEQRPAGDVRGVLTLGILDAAPEPTNDGVGFWRTGLNGAANTDYYSGVLSTTSDLRSGVIADGRASATWTGVMRIIWGGDTDVRRVNDFTLVIGYGSTDAARTINTAIGGRTGQFDLSVLQSQDFAFNQVFFGITARYNADGIIYGTTTVNDTNKRNVSTGTVTGLIGSTDRTHAGNRVIGAFVHNDTAAANANDASGTFVGGFVAAPDDTDTLCAPTASASNLFGYRCTDPVFLSNKQTYCRGLADAATRTADPNCTTIITDFCGMADGSLTDINIAFDVLCDDPTLYNADRDRLCLLHGTDETNGHENCATNAMLIAACPANNPFTGVGTTRCGDVMGIDQLRTTFCMNPTNNFATAGCADSRYGDAAMIRLTHCTGNTAALANPGCAGLESFANYCRTNYYISGTLNTACSLIATAGAVEVAFCALAGNATIGNCPNVATCDDEVGQAFTVPACSGVAASIAERTRFCMIPANAWGAQCSAATITNADVLTARAAGRLEACLSADDGAAPDNACTDGSIAGVTSACTNPFARTGCANIPNARTTYCTMTAPFETDCDGNTYGDTTGARLELCLEGQRTGTSADDSCEGSAGILLRHCTGGTEMSETRCPNYVAPPSCDNPMTTEAFTNPTCGEDSETVAETFRIEYCGAIATAWEAVCNEDEYNDGFIAARDTMRNNACLMFGTTTGSGGNIQCADHDAILTTCQGQATLNQHPGCNNLTTFTTACGTTPFGAGCIGLTTNAAMRVEACLSATGTAPNTACTDGSIAGVTSACTNPFARPGCNNIPNARTTYCTVTAPFEDDCDGNTYGDTTGARLELCLEGQRTGTSADDSCEGSAGILLRHCTGGTEMSETRCPNYVAPPSCDNPMTTEAFTNPTCGEDSETVAETFRIEYCGAIATAWEAVCNEDEYNDGFIAARDTMRNNACLMFGTTTGSGGNIQCADHDAILTTCQGQATLNQHPGCNNLTTFTTACGTTPFGAGCIGLTDNAQDRTDLCSLSTSDNFDPFHDMCVEGTHGGVGAAQLMVCQGRTDALADEGCEDLASFEAWCRTNYANASGDVNMACTMIDNAADVRTAYCSVEANRGAMLNGAEDCPATEPADYAAWAGDASATILDAGAAASTNPVANFIRGATTAGIDLDGGTTAPANTPANIVPTFNNLGVDGYTFASADFDTSGDGSDPQHRLYVGLLTSATGLGGALDSISATWSGETRGLVLDTNTDMFYPFTNDINIVFTVDSGTTSFTGTTMIDFSDITDRPLNLSGTYDTATGLVTGGASDLRLADDTQITTGELTGIIGREGALGVFRSTDTSNTASDLRYVGGFIAKAPQTASTNGATYADWVGNLYDDDITAYAEFSAPTAGEFAHYALGASSTGVNLGTGNTPENAQVRTLDGANTDAAGTAGADGYAFGTHDFGGEKARLFTGLLDTTTNLGGPVGEIMPADTLWYGTVRGVAYTTHTGSSNPLTFRDFAQNIIIGFSTSGSTTSFDATVHVDFASAFDDRPLTLNGEYDSATGLITSGTSDLRESSSSYTTGDLTGIIGADGIIGVFRADEEDFDGSIRYVGGFIATPTTTPAGNAAVVDYADWVATTTNAPSPLPDSNRKNEFLRGRDATTLETGVDTVSATAVKFGTAKYGSRTLGAHADEGEGGFAFYRHSDTARYAGVLTDTNLGAPITTTNRDGVWIGTLSVSRDTNGTIESRQFKLEVLYNMGNNTGTIEGLAQLFDPFPRARILVEGTFDSAGILSGTVRGADFSLEGEMPGDISTPGLVRRDIRAMPDMDISETNPVGLGGDNRAGTLSGLIGLGGAVGTFISGAGSGHQYAGGFIATYPCIADPDSCIKDGVDRVTYQDWRQIEGPVSESSTGGTTDAERNKNTNRRNQFLEGAVAGLVNDPNSTPDTAIVTPDGTGVLTLDMSSAEYRSSMLGSDDLHRDAKNGIAFYRATSADGGRALYAGIFSGTDLGAPLTDGSLDGIWGGAITLVHDDATIAARDLELTVRYTPQQGAVGVFDGFVHIGTDSTQSRRYLLIDGNFDARGVMTGVTTVGDFSINDQTAVSRDTVQSGYGLAIISGLIGADGAVGVFRSATRTIHSAEGQGYAGGFVAAPPTCASDPFNARLGCSAMDQVAACLADYNVDPACATNEMFIEACEDDPFDAGVGCNSLPYIDALQTQWCAVEDPGPNPRRETANCRSLIPGDGNYTAWVDNNTTADDAPADGAVFAWVGVDNQVLLARTDADGTPTHRFLNFFSQNLEESIAGTPGGVALLADTNDGKAYYAAGLGRGTTVGGNIGGSDTATVSWNGRLAFVVGQNTFSATATGAASQIISRPFKLCVNLDGREFRSLPANEDCSSTHATPILSGTSANAITHTGGDITLSGSWGGNGRIDSNTNGVSVRWGGMTQTGALTGVFGINGAVGAFIGGAAAGADDVLHFAGGFIAAPAISAVSYTAVWAHNDAQRPAEPNSDRRNEFLQASTTALLGTDTKTEEGNLKFDAAMYDGANLPNAASVPGGVTFYRLDGGDARYAGVLSDTALGAPISNGELNGVWYGQLQMNRNDDLLNPNGNTAMRLSVYYDGGQGRIGAFVPFFTAGRYFLLIDGQFNANGLITGTTRASDFAESGELEQLAYRDMPVGDNSVGVLSGIIGVNGVAGVFHSVALDGGNRGYSGGFVATSPCTSSCSNAVNYNDWITLTNPDLAPNTSSRANQFLQGSSVGFGSAATTDINDNSTTTAKSLGGLKTLNMSTAEYSGTPLGGSSANGVAYYFANNGGNARYATIFSGTSLGAPLNENSDLSAAWDGSLGMTRGDAPFVLDMQLEVNFNPERGYLGTVSSFVNIGGPSSDWHIRLQGTFDARGVIDGRALMGDFANQDPNGNVTSNVGRGVLSGLIGQQGAVGVFRSTGNPGTGPTNWAGGFVAVSPAGAAITDYVTYSDWIGEDSRVVTDATMLAAGRALVDINATNNLLRSADNTTGTGGGDIRIHNLHLGGTHDNLVTTFTGDPINGVVYGIINRSGGTPNYVAGIAQGANVGPVIARDAGHAKYTGRVQMQLSRENPGAAPKFVDTTFDLCIDFAASKFASRPDGTVCALPDGQTVIADGQNIVLNAGGDPVMTNDDTTVRFHGNWNDDGVMINTSVDVDPTILTGANFNNGQLTGIIGQGGAIGAFAASDGAKLGAAGGFVATPE